MTEFSVSLARWRQLRDDDELAAMLDRVGVDFRVLEGILAEVGTTDARAAEAFGIGFLNGLVLGRDTMADAAVSVIIESERTPPRKAVRPGLRRRAWGS